MHSRIFQIAEKPIDEENYINANSFENQCGENPGFFADYVSDICPEEQEKSIALLSELLDGICEVNGRELTVLDTSDFLNEWAKEMRELTEGLTIENVYDKTYDISKMAERTHRNVYSRFMIEDWNAPYADTFSTFVSFVTRFEPGAKLYVGGVVDFHW